jgi:hypothetical protein
VQTLHLGEQFLTRLAAQSWLEDLERETKHLGGQVYHPDLGTMVLALPFHNGKDLVKKFNQVLKPAHLALRQNNFLWVVHNHLKCDLDLRSLSPYQTDELDLHPDKAVEIDFELHIPWGIYVPNPVPQPTLVVPTAVKWTLPTDRLNHIEAIFWLPNFLGLGTTGIILLALLGDFLRHQIFPLHQQR